METSDVITAIKVQKASKPVSNGDAVSKSPEPSPYAFKFLLDARIEIGVPVQSAI